MSKPAAFVSSTVRLIRENRFLLLLMFLVLLIVVGPHLTSDRNDKIVQATLVSLVLLGAIDCLHFKKQWMFTGRWFGFFTLLSGWIPIFSVHPFLIASVNAFRIGFFLFVTGALIYQVAVSAKVTLPLIVGAIDAYLMLGIVGAAAFSIVEALIPGSVRSPAGMSASTDFIYFAFITMLTIGYGDVLPVGVTAQTIAVFLGVCGQLYIAILVSMLVGKFLASNQAGPAPR
jgi:voltage-gated potassium channel